MSASRAPPIAASLRPSPPPFASPRASPRCSPGAEPPSRSSPRARGPWRSSSRARWTPRLQREHEHRQHQRQSGRLRRERRLTTVGDQPVTVSCSVIDNGATFADPGVPESSAGLIPVDQRQRALAHGDEGQALEGRRPLPVEPHGELVLAGGLQLLLHRQDEAERLRGRRLRHVRVRQDSADRHGQHLQNHPGLRGVREVRDRQGAELTQG